MEAHEQTGGLGRHIIRGTVIQQGGQAVGLVAMLVVATALGRSLTLAEFGVYGLVSTFSSYLFFALGSAENAAIRGIAGALEQDERDRAFTTAMAVYVAIGLGSGAIVAVGGNLLIPLFDLRPALEEQARLGALAVGVLTAIGFPLRLFQDLLRATQRFALAAFSEASGYTLLAVAMLVALYALDAPLWVLTGIGGALPFFLGVAALIVTAASGAPYRLRRDALDRAELRHFAVFSGAMTFITASDVVISSVDRTILAALRSAATVGLYEGAARINTLARAFTGSLNLTLLPVVARLGAEGRADRERELFVRGTRYMLLAVVPPTVTGMVLAGPILAAWLGQRFAAAGTATAIFLALWLIAPNLSIPNTMLVVDGRLRFMAVYAWTVAGINLVLSIGLTAWLGLEGVALGTTLGYACVAPVYVRYALRRHDVAVAELARRAWLPAYAIGLALAAALGAGRAVLDLGHVPLLVALTLAGVAAGYGAVYAVLDAEERPLFRGLISRRPA